MTIWNENVHWDTKNTNFISFGGEAEDQEAEKS